eukprot:6551297-Prymnesium_polylepis.1
MVASINGHGIIETTRKSKALFLGSISVLLHAYGAPCGGSGRYARPAVHKKKKKNAIRTDRQAYSWLRALSGSSHVMVPKN